MDIKYTKSVRIAAFMELAIAVGIIAFWIAFFSADLVKIGDPHLEEIYMAFESAFPVADISLAIVLIIGGVGLFKRAPFGFLFSLLGGSSLIFLGLLDVSFNTQNGIYLLGVGEAVMNIFINLLCLSGGIFLIVTLWKNRTH